MVSEEIKKRIAAAPTFAEKTRIARGAVEARKRGRSGTALSPSQNLAIREGRSIKLTRGQKSAIERGGSSAATFSKQLQSAKQESARRESARQQKIQSGTIGGQVGGGGTDFRTPDPGTISAFRSEDFDPSRRFRRGAGESTKSFFGTVGKDIGIIATGLVTGRGFSGLTDPFKSFEQTGKQKGEGIVQVPEFGTITTDTGFKEQSLFGLREESQRGAGIPEEVIGRSPGAQSAFIGTQIAGELSRDITRRGQKEFEQSFDIIQGKVTSGDISVKSGTEALGAIGSSLETKLGGEFDLAFEKQFDIGTSKIQTKDTRLEKRSGETFGGIAREGAIFGGLALASAGAAPLTFAAASVLGGAVAEAKGAERTRDILFGAGLIGGLQAPGAIARSIDVGRQRALLDLRTDFKGFSISGKDSSISILGGKRDTGFASQSLDLLIPTLKTGKGVREGVGGFTIGGGRGISRTRITSFERQIGGATGEDAIIKASEQFSISGRGLTGLQSFSRSLGKSGAQLRTPLGNDITGTLGKLDIVTDAKVLRTSFGGVGETSGKIVRGAGGKADKGFFTFTGLGDISTKGIGVLPKTTFEIAQVTPSELFGALAKGQKGFGAPSKLTGLGPSQEIIKQLGGGLGTTTVRGGGGLIGASGQAAGRISEVISPSVSISKQIPFGGAGSLISFKDLSTSKAFSIDSQFAPLEFAGIPQSSSVIVGGIGSIGGFGSIGSSPVSVKGSTLGIGLSTGTDIASSSILASQQSLQFATSSKRDLEKQFMQVTPPSSPFLGGDFFGREGGLGRGAGRGFGFPPVIFPTFGSGRAPTRRVPKRKPGRIGSSLTGTFLLETQGVSGFLPNAKDLGVLGITPGNTRLRQRAPKNRIKVRKKKK